jgi:hypothetical protein
MSIRVNAVLDFPPAAAAVTIASGAKWGDVKATVAKELKIDEQKTPLTGYQFTAVRYGALPLDLTAEDSAVIGDGSNKSVAVGEGTTLVLSAPAAVKPKKVRRKAKDDEEEDGEKKSVDEDDARAAAYKGLTTKNVLDKLSKAEGKRKTACMEYIEMFAGEVLKSRAFAELKRETALAILSADGLNVEKEINVFNGAVAWAHREMKENAKKYEGADSKFAAAPVGQRLKIVWGADMLKCIRFTEMEVSDIALTLSKYDGLFDQNTTLALFTHLGAKKATGKSGGSADPALREFNTKPRKPRDPSIVLGLKIAAGYSAFWRVEGSLCTKASTGGGYDGVCSERAFEKGKHTVVVRFIVPPTNNSTHDGSARISCLRRRVRG